MRRLVKWIVIGLGAVLALSLLTAVVGGLWLRSRLTASLPRLEGELVVDGLRDPVTIERDGAGVPTLRGSTRSDLARATGFLHAQERFFQMDLLRRRAAGELAALLGPALVASDRAVRVHRFRALAERNLAQAFDGSRPLLQAYADGVNAGLEALGAKPPEYYALRSEPEPWVVADTTLVVLAMYLQLQDHRGRRESDRGLMHDLLPVELVEFLWPPGNEWDAPVAGAPLVTPAIPAADVFDLRRRAAGAVDIDGSDESSLRPGSNNWAVAGNWTADGGALLANDMHLPLALPNIWYRASLVWPDEESGVERRVTGVTLPGAHPIIVGSNGWIAWGFTNSYGDWSDLILLETDPADSHLYLTPGGPRPIETIEERIEVKGSDVVVLELDRTHWGPIVDEDHRGRRRALRWVAHDPQAANLGLARLERAGDVEEALAIATTTGIPTQNLVVADRGGRIGWTTIGPIPRRVGLDGRRPTSWSDGSRRWEGYLAPEAYPRIVDPAGGRIWTANNRVTDDLPATIGDGGFASGARAGQIRDGLLALERATAEEMLAIQLDDRALFLERWRELLLEALTPELVASDPRLGEFRRLVEESWTRRASTDSVGFRLVRAFRLFLARQVFGAITSRCKEADERFDFTRSARWEGALWKLVHERPAHLLDPRHESWDGQILSAVGAVVEALLGDRGEEATLERRHWGERNTVRLRHPMSLAVPQLSRWLDIPPRSLPGGGHMPRVQGVGFGASQRMVVSPGREEAGIFHMPGGQSGHPLSPYYDKGHEAWERGEPTPFLPGPTVHRLTLRPAEPG